MSTAALTRSLAVLALLATPTSGAPAAAGLPEARELRTWIEDFEASPKGPFERIRWFCRDGSVQPPRPYACADHGGGVQHGEWNARARALRQGGYAVANVLASVDPQAFAGPDADLFELGQILVERFLIGADDGWIFRGARSYRGALQIEDEEAGSRAVLSAMLRDPAWRKPGRFLLLRETVRLLPLEGDARAAADVRQRALALAEKDGGFDPLRAKIHNQPDAGDAAEVRAYAKARGPSALQGEYEDLAAGIDALYSGRSGARLALALAPRATGVPGFSESLGKLGKELETARDPAARAAIAGRGMRRVRDALPGIRDPAVAIQALQLSVALEADAVAASPPALAAISSLPRERRLELLEGAAEALYGAGFLTAGQLADVERAAARGKLAALRALPDRADAALGAALGRATEHLAPLEPLAAGYAPDRFRASAMPLYRGALESLGG